MRLAVVDHNAARRGFTQVIMSVTGMMVLAFSLFVQFTPASAHINFAAPRCGDGSAPDYGFTYDLQQEHWTVGWQDYASEQAVTEVDAILDRLNEDSIAQTMILIQPQEQVGNRVNCAVHFLRYMKLGLPAGERKDNGFAFLIVVESTRIDVHYGVGLGLPALTASALTDLNRAAEEAYQSTHSMDQALLTLVQGFDRLARSKYTPLIPSTPTTETIDLPPSGPAGIFATCALPCMAILFVLFLLWMLNQFTHMGFSSGSDSSWGVGFPRIGGRGGSGSSWGGGFPRIGGSGGGPSMRGGSGSGRSGRGN
jgi:hypothetical protein